jgi:hypothetical protein
MPDSAYEPVKRAVEELERRLYAALEACDQCDSLLTGLAERERSRDDPDPELLRRVEHLRSQVGELSATLEGPGIEALLPVMDRVLMIKVTEEGRFV